MRLIMNIRTILSLSMVLTIGGCGTSPVAKMYTLNAVDKASTVVAGSEQSIAIKLGPISIPDSLDKPQIVTRVGANRLETDEFNRWAGDYQSNIQRIIGENISSLLPTNQVMMSDEIILVPVDYQILVNVRKFDGELGGVVTLNADWVLSVKNKEKTVIAKKSIFTEKTDGANYQSYAAAQSRLLEKLSKAMVDEVRTHEKK